MIMLEAFFYFVGKNENFSPKRMGSYGFDVPNLGVFQRSEFSGKHKGHIGGILRNFSCRAQLIQYVFMEKGDTVRVKFFK